MFTHLSEGARAFSTGDGHALALDCGIENRSRADVNFSERGKSDIIQENRMRV